MQVEAKKYLYDIHQAALNVTQFTAGKRSENYDQDAMLRSAVERQFEIIGEALAQLAKLDRTVAERITEHSRIIAFRNILIHGYANVDDQLVWDIVQTKLPVLRREVEALLKED